MLAKLSDFLSGIKMTLISAIFLALSLILHLTGHEWPLDPGWVSIVISGYPQFYTAANYLVRERSITSSLLISIAILACIGIGEFFAAAEVAFIMALGGILEEMTFSRAKKALSKLIALMPVEARRLVTSKQGDVEEIVAASDIRIGDRLRVLPGEKIPADGEVVSGSSAVDQSLLTGESLPIDKTVEDSVFCGTLNGFGSIDIRATRVGEDSSLQKMIALVKEAEDKKAPMQRIADRWASILVPVALLISLVSFLIFYFIGLDLSTALTRAVTVLLVFCPCALALATPTSVIAAIGQATKHGVLIKSGQALESMGKLKRVAFDKTGTLSYGKLAVSDVQSFAPQLTTQAVLTLAASVEQKSEHPLAQSLLAKTREEGLTLSPSKDFQMTAGKGVSALVSGRRFYCGSEKYLHEHGLVIPAVAETLLAELRAEGKAAILLADGEHLLGLVALADQLRPEAKAVISALEQEKLRVVLLSGDHRSAAAYVGEQLGIRELEAELLPEDKVARIAAMQAGGELVCMIGDGINDAAALKTADVGIAMGKMGSDVAVEAADIALISDELINLPYLFRLSKATVKTIKFNIALSMLINFVAVALSLLGWLNPLWGALVHNLGSIMVVLNASFLYDRKF